MAGLRDLESARAVEALAKIQSVGAGVVLSPGFHIIEPGSLCVGNNVHIGAEAFFHCTGGVQIGDNTHISRRVTIYGSDHQYEGLRLPYDHRRTLGGVSIGKNVWVGMGASLLPGSVIEDGAIVGMGAVIKGRVSAGEIVAGGSFHVLGERNHATYERLEAAKAYAGVDGSELPLGYTPRPHACDADVDLVFAPTTGRSGSKTLAAFLDQHPNIESSHELRPQLIHWSTFWAEGRCDREELVSKLKSIYFSSATYSANHVTVEVDQKLFSLIDPLAALLPRSRFLWLIRDGRDTVNSMFARGWYSDSQHSFAETVVDWRWSHFRIEGPAVGAVSERKWLAMGAFERCCWYWAYVNDRIESQLNAVSRDRWLRVRLESLVSDPAETLRFLGVGLQPLEPVHRNRPPYPQASSRTWATSQRKCFEALCGAQMDRYYPGWQREW